MKFQATASFLGGRKEFDILLTAFLGQTKVEARVPLCLLVFYCALWFISQ